MGATDYYSSKHATDSKETKSDMDQDENDGKTKRKISRSTYQRFAVDSAVELAEIVDRPLAFRC